MSVVGQQERRAVVITEHFGLYEVRFDNGGVEMSSKGPNLESAIGKAAGENAPESWIHHAAVIFEGILARAKS